MKTKSVLGFTLLELLTTLSVSAITFGVGIPLMSGLIDSNRVSGQVNALSGALALTRSEAIKRNTHVVLCKSADGLNCNSDAGWEQGWIVFQDLNQNHTHDPEEELLLVQGRLPNGHTIDYHGFGSHHYVVYRPTGITQMNGTFILCSSNSPERSKALILMKTGRVRLSTSKPDGSPLDCPAESAKATA